MISSIFARIPKQSDYEMSYRTDLNVFCIVLLSITRPFSSATVFVKLDLCVFLLRRMTVTINTIRSS